MYQYSHQLRNTMPNPAHAYASCDRITLTGVAAVGFTERLNLRNVKVSPS